MANMDWYGDWYRHMREIYDSVWDSFMRDYVFSKDPPFKIVARPSRVLGDKSHE